VRLLGRQRLENVERQLSLAGDPAGGTQDQAGARMRRYRFEDFTGLFRGECGIPLEQSRGVSQRDVHCSKGFRSGVQLSSNIPSLRFVMSIDDS
jgi:hypothetical protein